jgi:hypothetical protein
MADVNFAASFLYMGHNRGMERRVAGGVRPPPKRLAPDNRRSFT